MSSGSRYLVRIKQSAEKEMDRLPAVTLRRVSAALLSLENNPRPRGYRKLQGLELYRIRVGDYRVLYTIADETRLVEIIAVGHRRDVYG